MLAPQKNLEKSLDLIFTPSRERLITSTVSISEIVSIDYYVWSGTACDSRYHSRIPRDVESHGTNPLEKLPILYADHPDSIFSSIPFIKAALENPRSMMTGLPPH